MKLISCLLFSVGLWAQTSSFIDFTPGTQPGNPSGSKIRLWLNSSTNLYQCLNNSGGSVLCLGSAQGVNGTVQTTDGSGHFVDSGCTILSNELVCSSAGPSLLEFVAGTPPANPTGSYTGRMYQDVGDNKPKFRLANGTIYTMVGSARILIDGDIATCQTGTTAAIRGSTGATNAPTATCEADGLSAYVSFTNNSGNGQTMYRRIDLPQDWLGTLKVNMAAWSTSINNATVNVSTACVGVAGTTTGITFNAANSFTFTPGASSFRTILAAQTLTTTGCSAGNELVVRYNIVGAAAASLNVRSLQVTE